MPYFEKREDIIDFFKECCYTVYSKAVKRLGFEEWLKGNAMAERTENTAVALAQGEVIEDMLIDGLKIIQNVDLYRFTSDSVLLSEFARVRNGDKIADFLFPNFRFSPFSFLFCFSFFFKTKLKNW